MPVTCRRGRCCGDPGLDIGIRTIMPRASLCRCRTPGWGSAQVNRGGVASEFGIITPVGSAAEPPHVAIRASAAAERPTTRRDADAWMTLLANRFHHPLRMRARVPLRRTRLSSGRPRCRAHEMPRPSYSALRACPRARGAQPVPGDATPAAASVFVFSSMEKTRIWRRERAPSPLAPRASPTRPLHTPNSPGPRVGR